MIEEIHKGNIKKKSMDFHELFKYFVVNRKLKFIRFLLDMKKSNQFDFSTELLTMTLDQGCEDMAMLLHKEYNSKIAINQIPKIISVLI